MRSFLARLPLAFKAAAAAIAITFGRGSGRSWWNAPRRNLDYARAVGDGSGSSLVMACVLWLCRTFPEAPLRVSEVDAKGQRSPRPTHALAALLARPNPFYSGILLWFATLVSWLLDGNAYWIKERSGAGRVVRLWWAPSWTMEPAWPADGGAFLSHYEYRPDASTLVKYAPQDVVHFRYGMDPRNMRKGLAPLGSLIREIFTDEEAAAFTAALLRNLGVPGVVLSPDGEYRLDQEDADAAKAEFEARFGGDNRGRPLVQATPMKVTVVSFNPDQMKLTDMRRVPEERVAAILGIPAIVVGFGAGLARSTFANYAEAREAAYESNIIPTQRLFGEELNTQLVPDFADDGSLVVDFDLSRVRVLQPDQDAVHARAREDWLAGVITLDEALQEIGREPLGGGAGLVRFVPNTGTLTHVDNVLPIAQSATAPLPSGGGRTSVAVTTPPAKGSKALAEWVTPAGADEPLDSLPDPTYDAAERSGLSRLWDETVGADGAGLLDATASGNGHSGNGSRP